MADPEIPIVDTPDKTEALLAAVERFAQSLEALDDDNVGRFLNERLCCNGHDCGCYGATVGEYLAHQLRETVRTL